MTGEMTSIDQETGIDNDGEEWYLHLAVAKALNGKLVPFDRYQGPYILIGDKGKLWLMPHKVIPSLICKWYNEVNGRTSTPFIDGKTKERLGIAIDSAKEVI